MSPLSGKMPIILRRIFSASLGCSQLVQHSDVPDHVVTLYELDSGKPGGSGGGKHKLAFQRPKLTRRREPPGEGVSFCHFEGEGVHVVLGGSPRHLQDVLLH